VTRRGRNLLATSAGAPPTVRVLVLAQFSFNVGFYMLMPYLAGYLSDHLGFAAWLVGLVLGLRVLSQQGLFVLGGALADRFGYRPVILVGCVLRTAAFLLLAVVRHPVLVVAAILLVGLAAALFSPAVQAYLALEGAEHRIEAFALFNALGELGALIGPLVGLALLRLDFAVVAVAAGGTFALITTMLARALPPRAGSEAPGPGRSQDWWTPLRNRPLVGFCAAMAGYSLLVHQLYLSVPLELTRSEGRAAGVGLLFAASSALSITGQVAVTRMAARRWAPGRAVAAGLALMALACLILAGASAARFGQDGGLAPASSFLVAALTATLVLTLGTMLAQPFAMEIVARLNGDRQLGTAYGVYYLAAALAVVAGNIVVGALFDAAAEYRAAPWLVLAAAGAGSAWAVARRERAGRLGPAVLLAPAGGEPGARP